MADRSNYKAGDRISWFMRPKRGLAHRTGTIVGVNWSQRLGLSWLVEVDQEGGKRAIVNPSHDPLLMKQWKDVRENDVVRLPPDAEAGDPDVLVGTVYSSLADEPGSHHVYLFVTTDGERQRTEVPVDPEGEVAIVSEGDSTTKR